MKTKMNKMNKKSIKSKLINYISLVLILSMAVCAGCKKETILAPNALPTTYSEVIDEGHQQFRVSSGQKGPDQASTNISTKENQEWFHELIELNPDASIVVNGPAIVVTNHPDVPLKLPKGPVPNDVKLIDNP